jgi:hypothetical protein
MTVIGCRRVRNCISLTGWLLNPALFWQGGGVFAMKSEVNFRRNSGEGREWGTRRHRWLSKCSWTCRAVWHLELSKCTCSLWRPIYPTPEHAG